MDSLGTVSTNINPAAADEPVLVAEYEPPDPGEPIEPRDQFLARCRREDERRRVRFQPSPENTIAVFDALTESGYGPIWNGHGWDCTIAGNLVTVEFDDFPDPATMPFRRFLASQINR